MTCEAPGMTGQFCTFEQTGECAWLIQIGTEDSPKGVEGLKPQLLRCGDKCARWTSVQAEYKTRTGEKLE